MTRSFLLLAALTLSAPAFAADPDWSVEGQWADTCDCATPCPCWEDKVPTVGHCQDLFFFHIDKGNYGATKLDGIELVQVGVSGPNKTFMKSIADKDFKLINFYVPKTLTPDQLAAVEKIFERLAVAPKDATKKFNLKKVDLKAQVTADEIKVDIPKVLSLVLQKLDKPYPADTTVAGWIGKGNMGKQVKFDFSDDGQSWKLKDHNVTFARFAWSSKKGPLPGEPGYQPPAAPPAPAKK